MLQDFLPSFCHHFASWGLTIVTSKHVDEGLDLASQESRLGFSYEKDVRNCAAVCHASKHCVASRTRMVPEEGMISRSG